jgi:hypothetical protein
MSPFLQLDALKAQRDEDFRQRHEGRLKEFGAAPLGLYDLYKEYQDREGKAEQMAHQRKIDEGQLAATQQNVLRQGEVAKAQVENLKEDNRRQQEAEGRFKTEQELKHAEDLKLQQRRSGELESMPYVTGTTPKKEVTTEEFDTTAKSGDFQQEAFLKATRDSKSLPDLSDDEIRGIFQKAKLSRGDIGFKQDLEMKKAASAEERWRMQLSVKRAAAQAASGKVKDGKLSIWAQKELTDLASRASDIDDALKSKRESGVESEPQPTPQNNSRAQEVKSIKDDLMELLK